MDRKKKLAVVMLLSNADPWVGGAQKQAFSLANALQSQGVGVSIVSKQRSVIDDQLSMVRLPTLDLHPGWSFLCSFLIWAVLYRKRYHLIHAHTPAIGVIACLVGWPLRKKVIVKVPSMKGAAYLSGSSLSRILRRRILSSKAARFVAVSSELAQAVHLSGVPPHKVIFLPNGIEVMNTAHTSHRMALKQRLLGDSGLQVVLFVGRLVEEKGLERLLKVWTSMPCRERIILLIVGDGPLKSALESSARASDILPSVRFLGHHTAVSQFYAIADLFVLPSRTEGMSNALLEAMAAGIPPIASSVGGNRDVIEDRVSGFLVDWENTTVCVDLLVRLLSDHHLRRQIGDAAYKRASTFAMTEVAQHYQRLYRTVLQERGV